MITIERPGVCTLDCPDTCSLTVTVEDGRITKVERWEPDRSFSEMPLPAVRAPAERQSCLSRLAALAAAS